jgi:hypothetical protein
VAEQNAAVVIDGGTDAGVMALMGQARAKLGGTFPLLGVAASGTIDLDLTLGRSTESGYQAPLEPHHSHFLLVPGDNWGDEALWISDVATALADPARCVTVLVNGGPIARDDVRHSLDAKRPVLVVAGTGRLADELAAEPDRPPLLAVIEVTTPKAIVKAKLQALLQG